MISKNPLYIKDFYDKKCEKCGRFGAMINKYEINLCRHCFREIAEDLGFKKYS